MKKDHFEEIILVEVFVTLYKTFPEDPFEDFNFKATFPERLSETLLEHNLEVKNMQLCAVCDTAEANCSKHFSNSLAFKLRIVSVVERHIFFSSFTCVNSVPEWFLNCGVGPTTGPWKTRWII